MDQGTLSWTVAVVLERGNHDNVITLDSINIHQFFLSNSRRARYGSIQANDRGRFTFIEMTKNRIAYLFLQALKIICFRKDRFA
jgi:hypothetical protein